MPNHSFAFVTDLPMTGAHITLDGEGAALGSTYRVIALGDYTTKNRNKEEDEDETGVLKGERKWDVEETLEITLGVPASFNVADMKDGYKLTLALAAGSMKSTLDGVWQIDGPSIAFSNKGRTQVKLPLRRNAGFTPTAQS